MTPRGLILAAPRSGSGKTTITLGLLAALRRRGIAVRAGKSGPDYIDPAFHAAATGVAGANLDSWAMPPAVLGAVAHDAFAGAEIVLIESAMGLFDGVESAPNRTGASADLARQFSLPVLLILDVSGQSQSAAAVARGFATHDPGVHVAGIVLNQVASARHRLGVEQALAPLGIPVLGCLMRDASLAMPERHLGLVQASEHGDLRAHLARLADAVEAQLDVDGVIALARNWALPRAASGFTPPGQRIALAQDAAFTFLYPHLLRAWRAAGAEILPFSPLADEAPPDHADICWLPGGYPELHAPALAAAQHFADGLARFAQTRSVHGECGGFMVLGQTLEDASGVLHQMTGLLGHHTSFAKRRLHLGYREATLLADGPLGKSGAVWRGHEFHYASQPEHRPDAAFATLIDGQGNSLGPAGGQRGLVSGTFFHAIAPQDHAL
jgi:cobyrinic acid a,c-diamide synthase